MHGPTCIFWTSLTPFSLQLDFFRRKALGTLCELVGEGLPICTRTVRDAAGVIDRAPHWSSEGSSCAVTSTVIMLGTGPTAPSELFLHRLLSTPPRVTIAAEHVNNEFNIDEQQLQCDIRRLSPKLRRNIGTEISSIDEDRRFNYRAKNYDDGAIEEWQRDLRGNKTSTVPKYVEVGECRGI